jgi:hypothetical protein
MPSRRIAFVALMMTTGIAALTAAVAIAQTRPTTQDTFDRLLGDGRTVDKPLLPAGATRAPDRGNVQTLREGTFIVDRVGRLIKSDQTNAYEFVFESDSGTPADAPIRVLPNLKLMVMEDAIEGTSRELRFRVTGMLTEYRGHNYVLLEKVVVVQDGGKSF